MVIFFQGVIFSSLSPVFPQSNQVVLMPLFSKCNQKLIFVSRDKWLQESIFQITWQIQLGLLLKKTPGGRNLPEGELTSRIHSLRKTCLQSTDFTNTQSSVECYPDQQRHSELNFTAHHKLSSTDHLCNGDRNNRMTSHPATEREYSFRHFG